MTSETFAYNESGNFRQYETIQGDFRELPGDSRPFPVKPESGNNGKNLRR